MTDGNDVVTQFFEVYENHDQLPAVIAKYGRNPAIAALEAEIEIIERQGTEYGNLCQVLQKAD